MTKTICLDFDGVMNNYSGWQGETELFTPREGVKAFLEALQQQGYEVVVHSTRSPSLILRWLRENGLYHLVKSVGTAKPPAVAYIDDRAICFKGDFQEMLDQLTTFKAFWEKEAKKE